MSKIEMDSFKNQDNVIFFTKNLIYLDTTNMQDIHLRVNDKRLCYYLAQDPLFPNDNFKKIFKFTTIQPGEANAQSISSSFVTITIIED